jgi:prevent-host-death family protein
MLQKASAMAVRQNLGELLNGVQYHHNSVLITKAGKPVAALVDITLFEKIRLMKAQFENLSSELAQIYENVDPKKVAAEIDEAVEESRRKK